MCVCEFFCVCVAVVAILIISLRLSFCLSKSSFFFVFFFLNHVGGASLRFFLLSISLLVNMADGNWRDSCRAGGDTGENPIWASLETPGYTPRIPSGRGRGHPVGYAQEDSTSRKSPSFQVLRQQSIKVLWGRQDRNQERIGGFYSLAARWAHHGLNLHHY